MSAGLSSWRPDRLTLTSEMLVRTSRLPPLRLPARLLDHPRADRHDEPGLLGDVDELAGHEQPALGMVPSQQRLDADDASR